MRELRDYQVRGLEALRQTVRQGVKRVALQLPTGGGKTLCAASIAKGAMAKGSRLAFCVPRIALIDQTVEEFYKEGIQEVGVIQANHYLTDWSKPIQVCSIDTIRSKGKFPDVAVAIFDEVHLFYDAHRRWMDENPGVVFVGQSATPWTVGLGKYFDTLLVMATTKDLIEQGYLSPFRAFATGHPDLRDVKIVAGEYHEGQLSVAMQQGTLVADIVTTWKEKWGKDKTLCFAVDCAHAQAIQQRFADSGVACGYQDARTLPDERREIKRKFHNGEYPVVASVGTLILGVDWDVRCISFCRPTRSEMLFCQAIGRGLRTAPGKESLLLLDHSDTTQRLGFVTDIHHEQLRTGDEPKKAEVKKPLPKECSSCGFLKPPRISLCPNCGFKPVAISGISEHDGELIEVTPGAQAKKAGKREYTMAEKSLFFAELKAYGVQHGRKDGWASYSYREKFGVWPDWTMKRIPPAESPSAKTVQWVRSRNIKWAKSKKNSEQPTGTVEVAKEAL